MTREEIIKIITQNKDILTPENYQNILKNLDVLSEEDKEKIVRYLTIARKMVDINKRFLEEEYALFQSADSQIQEAHKKVTDDVKKGRKKAEEEDNTQNNPNDLISNL